jgi:hypothetical protein
MYDDCIGYVANPFAATRNMIQLGFCTTVSQEIRTIGDQLNCALAILRSVSV